GIDGLLTRLRHAAAQGSAAEMDKAVDWQRWQEEYHRAASATASERDRKALDEQILKIRSQWNEWKDGNKVPAMRLALEELEWNLRSQLRDQRGSLRPDARLPLSDFSGLPANAATTGP